MANRARGTIRVHQETGRLVLGLVINGDYYGDYPLDRDSAADQLNMAMIDANDYGCDTIELEAKPYL